MAAKGIKQVKTAISREISDIAKVKTVDAIYAILFQGSEASKLMTPIDTSTLVNSLYAPRIQALPGKVRGTVGYTAKYAKAVHDAPGKLKGLPRADFGKTRAGVAFGGGTGKGTYWSPNAEPRFLEKGFEKIKPSIPKILKEYHSVK